ncbi:MAG: hypothetical protein BMS9Abin02_1266 [Anaerolineae bacterium]|nr:MAG: hypothetical protein BMS9Abin02_1266 [Anaerolineae bacterium]
MRRSVRWHLLISGLAVSLISILAVGAVTLMLVNSYFVRQEEEFLRERGDNLVEPLETVLRFGKQADLHQIASLGLLANQVRIKVVDASGRLLVDSGSFDDLIPTDQNFRFQFFLDDRGKLQGYDFPFTDDPRFVDPFAPPRGGQSQQAISPVVSFTRPEPITDLSSTSLRLPLQVDNQVVAFAELSEGPAFGSIIRDSIQKALLVGGIVALIVAALAALLSARQLTRPLQTLGEASAQMAAGKYNARAPASHLKEFDQFAEQFNIMADRLSETIESLEADRSALRRFIADASHELRTPLTALKTFNQLLSDQVNSEDEPKATFIAESGAQIAQLDQLTSDLLNLSRLESRLSGTDFVLSDLRQPIERAVQANLPLSEEKNQELEVHLPAEPLMLSHDPSAIERAVSNILVNAVKYSNARSEVAIRLSEDESAAYITVSDNGPGIPEEEQPYIFDRFFRGRNHKIEGSGLGLSIAQEIAMIHGGEIRLQSEDGQGSTFILELPKVLRS